MSRRSPHRHQYRYKGRMSAADKLRLAAAAALVLLLLAVGVLVFGQRYVVYTDDGPKLELPFFSREKQPESGDPGRIEVVLEPGAVYILSEDTAGQIRE